MGVPRGGASIITRLNGLHFAADRGDLTLFKFFWWAP